MLDQKEKAVAISRQNSLTVDDQQFAAMTRQLKLMVTNGKALSDHEAQALGMYAVQENLDPFAQECWYIPGVGPAIGIKGLRRKAQEQLPPTDYFKVDFRDVSVEQRQLDPDVLYAYEATLRDTKTGARYLELYAKHNNSIKAEMLKEILGPTPQWTTIGIFRNSQKDKYKDAMFSPQERAKKRAEALVIKKRFNLRYEVFYESQTDEDVDVKISQDEIAGSIGNGEPQTPEEPQGEYPEQREVIEQPEMDTKYDVNLRSPEQIKAYLIALTSEVAAENKKPVEQGKKGIVLSCLGWIMAPGDVDMKRHQFLKYIFGVSSSKNLTDAQWRALGRYLNIKKESSGEYIPSDLAITKEVNSLIAALDNDGQQALL